MTTVSIETVTGRTRFGRGSRVVRTTVGFASACLLVLGLAGSASAQSATSQLLIPPVVPPPSLQSSQAAPNQAGPTVSVLGTQVASTQQAATTKLPSKVLGETIVAPAAVSPAFTGSDVAGPVRLALTLGLAGTGIVLATRRRRRSA